MVPPPTSQGPAVISAQRPLQRRREGHLDEDEMAGGHRRLNRQEFEETLGDGDGQGGLACCSPWGLRESDTTERLN